MQMRRLFGLGLPLVLTFATTGVVLAGDANPPPPSLLPPIVGTNGPNKVSWTPYPAAEQYRLQSAPGPLSAYTQETNGAISGYDWLGPFGAPSGFYQLQVTPLSSNADETPLGSTDALRKEAPPATRACASRNDMIS